MCQTGACGCGCGPSVLTLPTGSAGATGTPTPIQISNTVFVSKLGSDTTGTVERLDLPFLTIGAAITAAVTLLSGTTRINIVVYGGTYTENITIANSYLNLVSGYDSPLLYEDNNTTAYNLIVNKFGGNKRPVYIAGTITVTADYTNIIGINCLTLAQNVSGEYSQFSHIIASTAITTNLTTVHGRYYDVHSDKFLSLTSTSTLRGYFEKCTAGEESFAGSGSSAAGNIAATLIDCIAETNSFASSGTNTGGTISGGILTRCRGEQNSFASSSSGTAGTIYGSTFTDCKGNTGSFASSTSGTGGTISNSKFLRCNGTTKIFASGVTGGTTDANCHFEDCYTQGLSFGSGSTTGGTLDGYFLRCTDTGSFSFGSGPTAGTLLGLFVNCIGEEYSFASSNTGTAGTIGGKMYNCKATDRASFASTQGAGTGGTISGYLKDCSGENYSFCSCSGTGGTVSGTLINCTSDTDFMLYKANLTGKLIGARVNTGISNAPAIIVADGATLTKCDLKGDGTASSVHATGAVNISATYLRTFGLGFNSNVTNLVTTPYIIDDINDIF